MSTGAIGAPGETGVMGLKGVVGATGATGDSGLIVQIIKRRVVRQAGCPGTDDLVIRQC